MFKTVVIPVKFHAALRDVRTTVNFRPKQPEVKVDAKPTPPAVDPSVVISMLKSIHAQLESIEGNRQRQIGELRELAIELGVMVAGHIVKKKLDADELPLAELVDSAIKQLVTEKQFAIHVHPEDHSRFTEIATENKDVEASRLQDHVEWIEDVNIRRGDCRVMGTDLGLASNLETRLANIRETLLQGIEHARP